MQSTRVLTLDTPAALRDWSLAWCAGSHDDRWWPRGSGSQGCRHLVGATGLEPV